MCVSTLNYKRAREKQIYHDTSATVIETQNVTKLRLAFEIATKYYAVETEKNLDS